jgi:N utilization substance protein B
MLFWMINRVIIRVKVLQIVYAYYLKSSKEPDGAGNSLKSAENELMRSLQHAYDLYHYLLLLIVLLTDAEQKRIDLLKHKFLPTKEELDPDMRLADNRLAEQIRVNKTLEKFANSHGTLWNEGSSNFIKNLLNKITLSDVYKEYLSSEDSYEADRIFWRKIFKHIIVNDEELKEIVSDNSIYAEDDVDVIITFVMKTIRRFDPENGAFQELLPMFKDEEDYRYAIHLLLRSIMEGDENTERINRQIQNWEIDRLALIDLYIMQIAIAELKNFPTIPISVTLNEYIDLARYYSTPKSAHFINGILDAIVNELKNEGLLFKN